MIKGRRGRRFAVQSHPLSSFALREDRVQGVIAFPVQAKLGLVRAATGELGACLSLSLSLPLV